ncbi:MAG: SpoIIE family protein phosphatase, partial [Bacteroidia bacterium]|nr:SpoIIE family protein phosphatase [Bacteroidia bacterium]
IQKLVPNSFVLYKPKDIVSGDFYMIDEHNGFIFVAAVDCTGHGVPGAFMSVIGSNLLNQIINELELTNPGSILTELDKKVRYALRQDINSTSKDGMDVCLCVLNPQTQTICFSGAFRPLYLLRDGEIQEFKGDRYPIGGNQIEDKIFKTIEIPVMAGDRFYLFSDGFVDQFGGEKGKKYTPKRLQQKIIAFKDIPITEQKNLFLEEFETWMKGYKQLDDVMLIGLEMPYA